MVGMSDDPVFTQPAPPPVLPVEPPQRPHWTRVVPLVVIAVIFFLIGSNLGGLHRSSPVELNLFGWHATIPVGWVTFAVIAFAVLFFWFGLIAVRALARELARVSEHRAGAAAASAVRLVCLIVGYLTVGLGLLGLLQVDLGNLLVGGAVTGVVIGIAAQQTLSNFFAGLVLFFARPYTPGERIRVRSGGMGGPFEGVIVNAGIMYTVIETDDGPIAMPNSGLLGSAIGPAPAPEPEPDDAEVAAG
jgi:small-conductance mechanosensitive channel